MADVVISLRGVTSYRGRSVRRLLASALPCSSSGSRGPPGHRGNWLRVNREIQARLNAEIFHFAI